MYESYGNWTLGIETCYMMSICKFSSIAFNYEDGGRYLDNEKEEEKRGNSIKDKFSHFRAK